MRVYTDDDIRRIDRTWLGPPNKRLPWVASYRQYVTIILVALSVFSFMLFLGFKMTELSWLAVAGALTYFIVRAINSHYRDDVGIIVNFITAYQELSVPREDQGKGFDKAVALSVHRHGPEAPYTLRRNGRAILRQHIWVSRIRSMKDRRTKV